MDTLQSFSLALLLIYFAIILSSVLKSKSSQNLEDYFLAGRQLPFWALAVTFIASWWGAGSAVETADNAFKEGFSAFWIYGMPVLFATLLMFIFAKAIRRIGTITQPQLLEERYGKKAALILSFLIFIYMTFNAAAQGVGIGIFFEAFLGINYDYGILIGTFIVLIYSFFGGFKGVVLTDRIQFVFLLTASIIVFIYAYTYSGGFEEIAINAQNKNLPDFVSFTSNISRNIMYIMTFGCAWMIHANVWQRISATRNPKDAQKMLGLGFFIFIPLYLMVTLTGMLSLGLYDTLPEGGIIPAIINDYMPPILGAVMFVGICSAIMSTMDSLINTGAMVLCVDIYKDRLRPASTAKQLVWVGKFSTLIVTVIAVIISLRIRSILQISWIAADFIATGAFVPLVLGFLWRRGNHTGALSSMVFGTLYSFYNLAISLGLDLPSLWEISSVKRVFIGMLGSLLVFITASFISKPENEKADKFINKAEFRS